MGPNTDSSGSVFISCSMPTTLNQLYTYYSIIIIGFWCDDGYQSIPTHYKGIMTKNRNDHCLPRRREDQVWEIAENLSIIKSQLCESNVDRIRANKTWMWWLSVEECNVLIRWQSIEKWSRSRWIIWWVLNWMEQSGHCLCHAYLLGVILFMEAGEYLAKSFYWLQLD